MFIHYRHIISLLVFLAISVLSVFAQTQDSQDAEALARRQASLEKKAAVAMSKYHGTKNLPYAHAICELGVLFSQPNTPVTNMKLAKSKFDQALKIAREVAPQSSVCADILIKTMRFYQLTDRYSGVLKYADHLYELTYSTLDSLFRCGVRDTATVMDYLPAIDVMLNQYAHCKLKPAQQANFYNLILLKKNLFDFSRKRGNTFFYTWRSVRGKLAQGEYAIDYISIPSGDSLCYAAAVLGYDWSSPKNYLVDMPDSVLDIIALNKQRIAKETRYYERLMAPLLKGVDSHSRLFISLDGKLKHLVVEDMKIADNLYFCDMYELHRVKSTLRRYEEPKSGTALQDTACLMGYADYGKGITWLNLEGTARELNNIYTSLKKSGFAIESWRGTDCSEERLRSLSGRRLKVLHIATHGYFVNHGNPHLDSGLILAGANEYWNKDAIYGNRIDGIATAAEISRLDLSAVDLVVLSACRTGVGTIDANEMSGLLEAFTRAGAKCVMLSNWDINDEATRMLMSEFYDNWVNGKNMSCALHEARKIVRKGSFQYSNGKNGLGSDPLFWGPFIIYENK